MKNQHDLVTSRWERKASCLLVLSRSAFSLRLPIPALLALGAAEPTVQRVLE